LGFFHLLGSLGAGIGDAVIPDWNGWWVLGLAFLPLFWGTKPSPTKVGRRVVGAVLPLFMVLFAIPRLVESFHELVSPLRAIVDVGDTRRAITLDSLVIDDRRTLNRLVRRRRNVKLQIEGYLYAPRDGVYEVDLSCDDRCTLRIDGGHVPPGPVELETGVHELGIQYVQINGQAHMMLSWTRPGWLQFLPMARFMGGRSEDLTRTVVNLDRLKLFAVLSVALLIYGTLFYLWATVVPVLRDRVLTAARAWSNASLETRKPPKLPRRVDVIGLAIVFLIAFAARFVLLAGQDMPIMYGHPYSYYNSALKIVEHPDPWAFILTSDEWHVWMSWTVAPMYYLVLAGLFHTIGPGLLTFRIVHALGDALVAICVSVLGRRLAGPLGVLAGVAYAFFWTSIELLNWTLTENLHTVLLVGGVVLLLREADAPGRGRAYLAGLILGLSAMTRAVSSAFLVLVFLWRLFLRGASIEEVRRNWLFASLVALGGATAILPWTARNLFIIKDPALIETVSFFNLYYDNEPRPELRKELGRLGPGKARRAAAVAAAVRGIRERPDYFVKKVSANFWHFLRPDGLHNWLRVEFPDPAWRHAAHVLFGDVPLIVGIVLFFPWLFAGPPSPARRLTLIWMGYYLLLVVVIFHNELRYRHVFFPFLFATTVGGFSVLVSGRRRFAGYAGLTLGGLVALVTLDPYWGPAYGRVRASFALRSARALVQEGAIDAARKEIERAGRLTPHSAHPYLRYGHWLARAGLVEEALAAYRKAQEIAPVDLVPVAVLPQLLLEADRDDEEVNAAIRNADRVSWNVDPWLMLEVAWRELPPPTTNVIDVGRGDYGAVRGFLHPRGSVIARRIESQAPIFQKSQSGVTPPGFHRFSRGVAWIRMTPTYEAAAHRVVIAMGSPYPSTLVSPR
jgi:tetratricopeptide (TPR) repeat protein